MSEVVGSISVVASINTKDYDAGKKHIERANDELEGGAVKTSKAFGGAWTGAIAGVSAAIASNLINSVMNLTSAMSDTYDASVKFPKVLQAMGATGQESADAFKDLKKYADETVYSLEDMTNTFGSLYGVAGKSSGRLVKALGGISTLASDQTQAMKSWSLQLTQMVSKPSVAWQDFRILLEQNPGAIAKIGKQMNLTSSEFITAVMDGTVATEDFLKALEDVGNDKSLQDAATSTDTVKGAMGQLQASVISAGASLMEKFGPTITTSITAVSKAVDGVGTSAGKIIDAFGGAWKTLQDKMKPTIDWINTNVVPVFEQYVLPVLKEIGDYIKDNFISAWNDLKEALGPFADQLVPVSVAIGVLLLLPLVAVGVIIGAIIVAISKLVKSFGEFIKWASKTQEAINKWLEPSFKAIGKAFEYIVWYIDLIRNFDLYESGKALIDGFVNGMMSRFDKTKNAVKSLMESIAKYFPHSPAKAGPFSGLGYTSYSGQALMQDFAGGIASQTKLLTSTANGALAPLASAFDGGEYEPAGIVHKGEYVVPNQYVNQSTGLPNISGGTEYNIQNINISSEVDGDRWLRRLTNNTEIESSGLVPTQRYA